jgi:glycosyltransferase A (GT-A) superfamily protein (DUF2064 family)
MFALGFDSVTAIGGDSPTLPAELVSDAMDCLETENDVVVIPAEDDGYCLIGMRKSHKELFQNIPWSTRDVMAATERQAKAAGLSLSVGPTWFDVDTPEEFERLKQDLAQTKGTAKFTRRFLKELAVRNREIGEAS